MWRIFLLLLFARESLACDCPGITINGTDQPYCWQIVDRNESTWSSADDACAAIGGRMGQPEDNETLVALSGYLKKVFSLPVLTGYAVGNAQTGEVAVVCRDNQFLAVANDTDLLILGEPSEQEACVFITNDDYRMHFGPCSTLSVVLCSQPEEENDSCAVAPTCPSTKTTGYNTPTTYRTTTDFDSSSTSTSTSFSPPTGTFSTLSTTTGTGSVPTNSLLSSTTSGQSGGIGGDGGGSTSGTTTTPSSKSTCKSGGTMFFGWCVPWWLLILTLLLLIALVLCCIITMCHFCIPGCFCHERPKAAAAVTDVEKGPSTTQKLTKAVQCEPEPQLALPPPVTQPVPAVIPAPIPMDYNVDKPETEDKGMMTDPWEAPEPVIIYRDREPEPKVEYEREERMILPPPPITARSEAPQFMESEDEDAVRHRVVAAPIPVIVRTRPRRRQSPDLPTPRDDPFPVLPRRALTDDDLPMGPRQPKEKKKRTRPHLEPVVFLHNARPDERPFMEEPEEPAQPISRGPRAFPPPPPGSRTSATPDRPFPEQFKSPSPGPKASRPLPPPPPAESNKRTRSPSPPAPIVVPPKQSRPLTRTPVNRPVITQQPQTTNDRRSVQPPPPAAVPLRSSADEPQPRSAKAPPPSGGTTRAAPVRARTLSPPRREPAQRSSSPFAPKQNSVSPAPQGGSLFKAAPTKESTSNLRAANGKLGGVAGGHGEVPRGWKAWSSNAQTFSTNPGSDF